MSRIKRHKISKAESGKAKKKDGLSKSAIITLIIGGVMLLSTFGIMFSSYNSGTESVKYGDYMFKKTTAGWQTNINGKEVVFGYHPIDLEKLNISKEVTQRMLGAKVVYVTFNPNSKHVDKYELARYELGNSLAELFTVYAMPGITEANSTYKQPIVTCLNATSSIPVIDIVEGNETKASVEANCITLQADEYTIIALKDRLLYSMLGIMT